VHTTFASGKFRFCLALAVTLAGQPVVLRAEALLEPTAAAAGRYADCEDGDHDDGRHDDRDGHG